MDVESLCQQFYAEDGRVYSEDGRSGLPPGRYSRLLYRYFEGLDASAPLRRGRQSFALRELLGLVLPEAPLDHSTIARTRGLVDLETHQAVNASAVAAIALALGGLCFRGPLAILRERAAHVVRLLQLALRVAPYVTLVRAGVDQLTLCGFPFRHAFLGSSQVQGECLVNSASQRRVRACCRTIVPERQCGRRWGASVGCVTEGQPGSSHGAPATPLNAGFPMAETIRYSVRPQSP